MKIPNNRELQHIDFNHSSGVEFNNFINFLKSTQ